MSLDSTDTKQRTSLGRRLAPWLLAFLAFLAWIAAPVSWRAAQITVPRSKPLASFHGNGDPMALRFSDDGRTLAMHRPDQSKLTLWDVDNGSKREIDNVSKDIFPKLRYLADGSVLFAEKNSDSIRVRDLASGKEVAKIPANEKNSSGSPEISPDGKTLLTFGTAKEDEKKEEVKILQLLDVGTGSSRLTLSGKSQPQARFSADGSVLFTWVSERRRGAVLTAYEVASGKELGKLPGATTDVGSYAISADGRRLVTRNGGSADLVDMTTGKKIASYQIDKPGDRFSAALVLSPVGSTLAVMRMNMDRVTMAKSPVRLAIKNPGRPPTFMEELMGAGDAPPATELSEEDKHKQEMNRPVTQDRAPTAIEILDASTGEKLTSLPYAEISAFQPDGKTLAAYYPDEQSVRLWDIPPRHAAPPFTVWVMLGLGLVLTIASYAMFHRRRREPAWE